MTTWHFYAFIQTSHDPSGRNHSEKGFAAIQCPKWLFQYLCKLQQVGVCCSQFCMLIYALLTMMRFSFTASMDSPHIVRVSPPRAQDDVEGHPANARVFSCMRLSTVDSRPSSPRRNAPSPVAKLQLSVSEMMVEGVLRIAVISVADCGHSLLMGCLTQGSIHWLSSSTVIQGIC
jgi:hypothetical protein